MIVSHEKNVNGIKIEVPGYENAFKKVLVSPQEGWEGYVMRLITLSNKGCSAKHVHDWQHIVFVIKGQGTVTIEEKKYPLEAGSFIFIPPHKTHQLACQGDKDLAFICIVPERGD